MMLALPQIDPVALSLGRIKIHWYGLMYLIGFLVAWWLAHWRARRYQLAWSSDQISDLIFYAALGVILGGRLGYMLFYQTDHFLTMPWIIFKLWEGGMSFHGGLLGVLFALFIFSKKIKRSFLEVSDFIAPLVPFGLGMGRLGNFINGELWGRVTDVSWAMVFPHADGLPRHPSSLYEFFLEGVLLFIIVWWYASRPRPLGRTSALFLMVYAICRIGVEFFREPDVQLGFLAFDWLTMGQCLSLPMFLAGLYLWWVKGHENVSKAT